MKFQILITAGPTREYLDPVRYISNESTGKMGFALARAATHLGCTATLIAGPVDLETPEGVKRIDVVSARDMYDAVMKQSKLSDVIIMAAAVADWTASKVSKNKIKKTARNKRGLKLNLKRTADILAELSKRRRDHQKIVGFALETKDLERNAMRKIGSKGCDWIIANSVKAISAESTNAILIGPDGKRIRIPKMPKEDLAVIILSHVL